MEQQAQQAAIEQANIAARVERRGILQQEITKVERCDGSDPSLVRRWLKEIQLSAPYLNEDIEMIENFTRFQKPKVAGKIRLSLMGFLAGIALALGISLALDFNKFLDRVEDSRKQAA